MREAGQTFEQVPRPKLEFKFLLWHHAVEDFSLEFFAEQIKDADLYVKELTGVTQYEKERAAGVTQGKFSEQAVKELAGRSRGVFEYRELVALHGSKKLIFFPDTPYFSDFYKRHKKEEKRRNSKEKAAEDSFFAGDFDEVHRNIVAAATQYVALNQERERMIIERLQQLPVLIQKLVEEGSVPEEGWVGIDSDVIARLREKIAEGREIKIISGYGAMHTTLARSLKAHFQTTFKGAEPVMVYSPAGIIDRKIGEHKEVSRMDALRVVVGRIFRRYIRDKIKKYNLVEEQAHTRRGQFLFKLEHSLLKKLEKSGVLADEELEQLALRFSENAKNIRRVVPDEVRGLYKKIADCFPGDSKVLIQKNLEEDIGESNDQSIANLINKTNGTIFINYLVMKARENGFIDFPIDPEHPEEEKRKLAVFCEEVYRAYEFPKNRPAVQSE